MGKGGKFKTLPLVEPSVGAMWGAYRQAVLTPSGITGGVQLQESRRIWYSAMGSLLSLLAQIADKANCGEIEDDEAAAMMEAMHKECMAFMGKLSRGEEGY